MSDRAPELMDTVNAVPGWSAIVVPTQQDLFELTEYSEMSSAELTDSLADAVELDVQEVLTGLRRENSDGEDKAPGLLGEWPADSPPLPADPVTPPPEEVHLVAVSVDHPAQVPAAMGWEGEGGVPTSEECTSILAHWAKEYGAVLREMTATTMSFDVKNPPTTREAATELAWEHSAFCSETTADGVLTYAAWLLAQPGHWHFWW